MSEERTSAGLQIVIPGCERRTLPKSTTRVDEAGQGLLQFYTPPSLRERLESGEIEKVFGLRMAQDVRQALTESHAILLYRADDLYTSLEEFLVERVGLSARAAYSTFNMGCGFAVYCAEGAGDRVVEVATALGLPSLIGGSVQEGPRRVVLEPVDVVFESADLDLAPERG